MDNQYNQYFQSLLGKRGQQFDTAPAISQPPQLQNYFSSENVLGNPNAQNSAQRAEAGVNDLRKSYESVLSYNNPQGQELAAGEKKYAPNSRVFAGGYFETDSQGRLKDEMYDIAQKMNSGQLSGFAPMGGGGGGGGRIGSNALTTQNQVNLPKSTSLNVAKFGETPRQATEFETHLAQIRGQKGETMGNADDRARWEAQAYRAKAESEAQAEQDKKDQEQKKLMDDERKRAMARKAIEAENANAGKK